MVERFVYTEKVIGSNPLSLKMFLTLQFILLSIIFIVLKKYNNTIFMSFFNFYLGLLIVLYFYFMSVWILFFKYFEESIIIKDTSDWVYNFFVLIISLAFIIFIIFLVGYFLLQTNYIYFYYFKIKIYFFYFLILYYLTLIFCIVLFDLLFAEWEILSRIDNLIFEFQPSINLFLDLFWSLTQELSLFIFFYFLYMYMVLNSMIFFEKKLNLLRIITLFWYILFFYWFSGEGLISDSILLLVIIFCLEISHFFAFFLRNLKKNYISC